MKCRGERLGPSEGLALGQRLYRTRLDAARRLIREMPSIDPRGGRSPRSSVSAVVATHNDERTIACALYSLINQSVPYDEIIVVNDASTDSTLQVIELLASRYPSMEILSNHTQAGPSYSRDRGIRAARSELVTTLDGDDLALPWKNQLEGEVGDEQTVAFGDIALQLAEGMVLLNTAAYGEDRVNSSKRVALLAEREPSIPRDMLIPKDLYHEVGGFDYRFGLFEDIDLKLRLANSGASWRRTSAPSVVYDRSRSNRLSGTENRRLGRSLLTVIAKNHGACRAADESWLRGLERIDADLSDALKRGLESSGTDLSAWTHWLISRRFQSIPDNQVVRRLAGLGEMLLPGAGAAAAGGSGG